MLRQTTQIPVAALYARLFRDDELQGESNSIMNQRRILEAYCHDHNILNYRFFVDDGWSGANFDRPNFKAMLEGIENGEIKTVITKDLSRLGRNYLQVGMYTEMLFPQKGVRYIAINDGVDSMQGDNDLTPLKNLFNEWMVRDTSKKIKAVFRSKGMSGKPITSQPVYGYLKGEDGSFVIDEEAAPVVRQIFNLCLAGYGPTQIARKLTEQNIPTPGTLEYRRTGSTRRYYPDYPCKWATNTIVHILERKEYLGHTVNFKTESPSYKIKKTVYVPEEKQAVFENTHEPILDRDTWERVQELRKQRKRPNRYGEVGLFSGLLFCADCGSVLYQQRYQTDKRKQDCYICGSYKKRIMDCTAHFIRTDHLAAGVTENIRKITSYAAKHEARFRKLLIEQNEDGGKRKNAARRKELDAAEKRIAELSAIFKRLYEDSVAGRITDERFTELSADYEAEQKQLKDRAAELEAELSKAQEATVNADRFLKVIHKYMGFEELTHTLLREFVEKIIVHECYHDANGTRRQDVEIYYNFVGKIDLPE
jgi:site-specific recombinases, DNA invertase pin homologs